MESLDFIWTIQITSLIWWTSLKMNINPHQISFKYRVIEGSDKCGDLVHRFQAAFLDFDFDFPNPHSSPKRKDSISNHTTHIVSCTVEFCSHWDSFSFGTSNSFKSLFRLFQVRFRTNSEQQIWLIIALRSSDLLPTFDSFHQKDDEFDENWSEFWLWKLAKSDEFRFTVFTKTNLLKQINLKTSHHQQRNLSRFSIREPPSLCSSWIGSNTGHSVLQISGRICAIIGYPEGLVQWKFCCSHPLEFGAIWASWTFLSLNCWNKCRGKYQNFTSVKIPSFTSKIPWA